MFNYKERLRGDIARWRNDGLIDGRTADVLAADVERRHGDGFTFGNVLAIMAAVLVGAAILVFIAANWEGIPRPGRVGALFALMAASYVGGAVLKQRNHAGFGEGMFLIGAVTFGGAIALIGQMYHMTGDETQAALTWCVGTIIAALGLRSPVLTVASVLIAVAWFLMRELDYSSFERQHTHGFLLVGALIWAVSYWTGSRAARHLLLLSLVLYAWTIAISGDWAAAIGLILAVVSALVFLVAYWAPDWVERFAKLGGPYPAHSLIGFVSGLTLVQMQVYDSFGPMLLTTLLAFAGIVAALVMRGKESRLMRWLAYAAFTVELLITYVVTVGSMIDTAGLFLFSGLALALVAFFIIRVERRLAQPPLAQGGVK